MISYKKVMYILWGTVCMLLIPFLLCLLFKRTEALISIGALAVTVGNLMVFSSFKEEETDEEEHVNVLFKKQKKSAKKTGKISSPANIKKEIDSFYKKKKWEDDARKRSVTFLNQKRGE